MPSFAIVVGARPNFMKAAPLVRAFARIPGFKTSLIHTGQHYDPAMSAEFFKDLKLPKPKINLEVGSHSQGTQTALIMMRLEEHLSKYRPDCLIVVGDVNSTMAGALVAKKLGIPIAHIEAGLRSFDWSMPEEVNRAVTDSITDLFFTTDRYAGVNLLREGHAKSTIHFVGNVMIDSLINYLPEATRRDMPGNYQLTKKAFVVATIHRPQNADHVPTLRDILRGLATISREWPVVLPVHPRTRPNVEKIRKQLNLPPSLILVPPLSYLNMLSLTSAAAGVITDSGGLQEEAAYLRIPTLTVRPNTERPITIDAGTNHLVASDATAIVSGARKHFGVTPKGTPPPLWDGKAGIRIAGILKRLF